MKQRCHVQGCGRYARAGQIYCTAHYRVTAADRAAAARPAAPGAAFFGADLAAQIARARDAGIDMEDALKAVMLVQLEHETDASRLASSMAKLAGAQVLLMKQKRVIDGDAADALTDAVTTILQELNQ